MIAPRPHPGGQPRAHAGRREVRPPQGVQVLDLRHVVDPPGDRSGHRRQGPHDPAALPPRRHHGGPRPRPSATMLKTLGREPTAAELAEETGIAGGSGARRLRGRPRPRVAVGLHRRGRRRAGRPRWPTTPPRRPSTWPPSRWPATTCRPCSTTSTRASGRSSRCASGWQGDQPLTLDEVGRRFNVTRERIRQIEAKALTKLRHPCSARHRRLVDALPLTHRKRRLPRPRDPGSAGGGRAATGGLAVLAGRASLGLGGPGRLRQRLRRVVRAGRRRRASTLAASASSGHGLVRGRQLVGREPPHLDDLGRPRPRRVGSARCRAGPEDDVDPLRARVTTTAGSLARARPSRPTSSRTSRRAASAASSPPLEQAARQAPAVAVGRGGRAAPPPSSRSMTHIAPTV